MDAHKMGFRNLGWPPGMVSASSLPMRCSLEYRD